MYFRLQHCVQPLRSSALRLRAPSKGTGQENCQYHPLFVDRLWSLGYKLPNAPSVRGQPLQEGVS